MIRTSQSHPLRINFLQLQNAPGRIGMTLCPGKHQLDALTGVWERSLELDVQAIVDAGITFLVTLMESCEIEALEVSQLGECCEQAGLEWYQLAIVDGGIPDEKFESLWTSVGRELRWALRNGESVLLHCKGGLGRTGMIAARLLMDLDTLDADSAIRQVRAARSGTIETAVQEEYLRSYAPKKEPCDEGIHAYAVIHWDAKRIEALGLGNQGFPVPLALFQGQLAVGSELQTQQEITTFDLLSWMQDFIRYDHAEWRDFDGPILQLAARLASTLMNEESLEFDSSSCQMLLESVDLNNELITIQRQGQVLAACSPTVDGRIRLMALNALDTRSLEIVVSAAIHPEPNGSVCMRKNNWEYLKDLSAGMGQSYASQRGESYLSYWRQGLGWFDAGNRLNRFSEQCKKAPVAPAVTGVQLELFLNSLEE